MRSRDAALGVGLTVGALLVGCGEEAPIGTPSPTAAAVDGPERGEAGGANDPLEAVDRLMRENRYPEATLAIAEALARTTDPADRERLRLDAIRCRAEAHLSLDEFSRAFEVLDDLIGIDPEHRDSASRRRAVLRTWFLLTKPALVATDDLRQEFSARWPESTTRLHEVAFGLHEMARDALRGGRIELCLGICRQQSEALVGLERELSEEEVAARGYRLLNAYFLNLAALARLEQGEFERSLEALRLADEIDPENPTVRANRKALGLGAE